MERQTIDLFTLFNEDQLRKAVKIMDEMPTGIELTKRLRTEVVDPAMPHINEVSGQQSNAQFFSYALQHYHLDIKRILS